MINTQASNKVSHYALAYKYGHALKQQNTDELSGEFSIDDKKKWTKTVTTQNMQVMTKDPVDKKWRTVERDEWETFRYGPLQGTPEDGNNTYLDAIIGDNGGTGETLRFTELQDRIGLQIGCNAHGQYRMRCTTAVVIRSAGDAKKVLGEINANEEFIRDNELLKRFGLTTRNIYSLAKCKGSSSSSLPPPSPPPLPQHLLSEVSSSSSLPPVTTAPLAITIVNPENTFPPGHIVHDLLRGDKRGVETPSSSSSRVSPPPSISPSARSGDWLHRNLLPKIKEGWDTRKSSKSAAVLFAQLRKVPELKAFQAMLDGDLKLVRKLGRDFHKSSTIH